MYACTIEMYPKRFECFARLPICFRTTTWGAKYSSLQASDELELPKFRSWDLLIPGRQGKALSPFLFTQAAVYFDNEVALLRDFRKCQL